MAELQNRLNIFVGKEIERDYAMVPRIKTALQENMFGAFGFAHMPISHLLAKDGIFIPYEAVGDIVLSPEGKYSLLIKYDILGLDTAELRSSIVARDCDPLQVSTYFELIPYWFVFQYINMKRGTNDGLVKLFWENLETITQ